MSQRLDQWIVDQVMDVGLDAVEADIQNGEIEKPEWLATGFTALGFSLWDTEESDGRTNLYTLDQYSDVEIERQDEARRWDSYDEDRDDFADPGGRSALRAETEDNPRNLPCPTCGREDMLTPADRARGYQCDICADQAERGY